MKRKFGNITTDIRQARAMASRITLNPRERQLKDLLVTAAVHIDQQDADAKQIAESRTQAGPLSSCDGPEEWVRDKLSWD